MLATSTSKLRSGAPKATLVNAFAMPFDNAIATARTCYSSRIITPEEVGKDERAVALRDDIAASTYLAGHHTTLQHATFQFALENVSRQAIWSFLHAHPHYNSEQVSQRYVAVKKERALIPELPSESLQRAYEDCLAAQMAAYQELVAVLRVPAGEAFFGVFPARRKKAEDYAKAIGKKAQEAARYVLPIATHAHLYHTISGLVLHRLHRLSQQLDVPTETSLLVEAMVAAVNAHDPLFFRSIERALPPPQTHEERALASLPAMVASHDARAYKVDFDAQLGGAPSALLDYSGQGEHILAEAVRNVLGALPSALPDAEAIALVLDARRNPYLGEALNLHSLGKLTRALVHPHYTFRKRLSHAADSQNQRHRATPASRPITHLQYAPGAPDVVAPSLIAGHPEALCIFERINAQASATIDLLLDAGVPAEQALYLLPNATAIRFLESGDLLGWHHKWVSRLCYNAQEEIWRASLAEVTAVSRIHPTIGRYLQPPCGLRAPAGSRPICPEGSRYCGVPVWKLDRSAYERVI